MPSFRSFLIYLGFKFVFAAWHIAIVLGDEKKLLQLLRRWPGVGHQEGQRYESDDDERELVDWVFLVFGFIVR